MKLTYGALASTFKDDPVTTKEQTPVCLHCMIEQGLITVNQFNLMAVRHPCARHARPTDVDTPSNNPPIGRETGDA